MNKSLIVKASIVNFLITLILSTSSIAQRNLKVRESYTSIPSSTKKIDIPLYENPSPFEGLPYVYWHFTKQKEEQLDLISPEVENIDKLFRIWIVNPVGRTNQPHAVIEITCKSNECKGQLIFMRVKINRNKLTETITKSDRFSLTPTSLTWLTIIDSLIQFNFDSLPTDQAIPNYYKEGEGYGNNSPTFCFEYATQEEYRFYQYNDIGRTEGVYWQVENVLEIFELLENEFQWDSRAREYF